MPNRKRKSRPQAEARDAQAAECLRAFLRGIRPLVNRASGPLPPSARHLRNAGIEVLEAMRSLLDETIEWLRKEQRPAPGMRRIRVQD